MPTDRTITTEFPDFDIATLPPIPATWTDVSWHNDACPRFADPNGIANVWIDYANDDDREHPGFMRYTVNLLNADGTFDEHYPEFASDDWQEILAYVAEQTDAVKTFLAAEPQEQEPRDPLEAIASGFIATLETEHFTFEAHAVTKYGAAMVMVRALREHARQYDLPEDWFIAAGYVVEARAFVPGLATRDGARLVGPHA